MPSNGRHATKSKDKRVSYILIVGSVNVFRNCSLPDQIRLKKSFIVAEITFYLFGRRRLAYIESQVQGGKMRVSI